MLVNTIVTSDLHLTDNPRDDYRWEIFELLSEMVEEHKVNDVYILGDLTDAKDGHSSVLVNRIVDELHELSRQCAVSILKGNHDYSTGKPFFGFVGFLDRIWFHSTINGQIGYELWLPHTRAPLEDWKDLDFNEYPVILMHETVNGSVASNGMKMSNGISSKLSDNPDALILSGDIHVPQTIGQVVYCGSPYHVHFGDRFSPRVLRFDGDGGMESHTTDFPERFTIEMEDLAELDSYNLREGDGIKVRLPDVPGESFRSLRDGIVSWCKEHGIILSGIELVRRQEPPRRRTRKRLGGKTEESSTSDRVLQVTDSPETIIRDFGAREGLSDDLVGVGITIANDASIPSVA